MLNKEQKMSEAGRPNLHKANVGSSASSQYRLQDDEGEIPMDTNCPKCNRTYDEIDYDYQICHYCKYNNNK